MIKAMPVYDEIAQEYKLSKKLEFRIVIERYMLFALCGNIHGLKIMDLGCGEGIYTRMFKKFGAREVTGVDISTEMVALAQQEEFRDPLGCRYLVADAMDLNLTEIYDLVVGNYILNYARNREQLRKILSGVYLSLRPGQRFIGINDNPGNLQRYYNSYKKYGFIKESPPSRQEGDPISYTFFNKDGSTFKFDNYYLDIKTYEEAFRAEGFTDFRWERPKKDPNSRESNLWSHFLRYPPIIGFSARRP